MKSKSFLSFKWVVKVKNDFQNKSRKLYAYIWQPSMPSPNPFKSKEQFQCFTRETRIWKDIKFLHIHENDTYDLQCKEGNQRPHVGLLMIQSNEKHQAKRSALYIKETIQREPVTHIPHFRKRTGN